TFLGSVGGNNVFRTYGYIGHGATGSGSVTVSGLGSLWTLSNTLYGGFSGTGSLTLTGGGRVASNYGELGFNAGSTGTATISGTGSQMTLTGHVHVGFNGQGTLTVTDGGTLVVASISNLAYNTTGTGTATVSGTGSNWSTNLMYLGGNSGGSGGNALLT